MLAAGELLKIRSCVEGLHAPILRAFERVKPMNGWNKSVSMGRPPGGASLWCAATKCVIPAASSAENSAECHRSACYLVVAVQRAGGNMSKKEKTLVTN